MSIQLSNSLFDEYAKILKTGEFSDVEILVGENENTKIFRLHSFVLKVCSPYFRSAFSSNWIKVENNIIKFQKPNISVKVFEILINYIYSGKLELANNDVKTNISLLIAADELCLNKLCSYIENYLLNDKESLKSNFILILHTVNKFKQFTELSRFFEEAIKEDPTLVLRADDFSMIGQEHLIEFLTENNSSLRQIEVWDKLMEWVIAKSNGILPSDVTKWTIDNVTTFGTLIQPFISLINFQEISRLDFFQKIKPFKVIFDDKFYIKIIEYYCFNNVYKIVNHIDSQIINLKEAKLISKWIKVIKRQKQGVTYDFNLLVRGSRDGFDKKTFHKCCDNKGPTITITRVKNYNEILGGFNPCNWESVAGFGRYINTQESFIFSLNKNIFENSIFSKVIETNYAIYNGPKHGPCFGSGKSDFELLLSNENNGQCFINSYEKAIGQNDGYFEIDDYEVFQVVYK
ncbi:hypothetical protein RclHR1_17040001 [Rhizophagus clarus]|uniref:BTB/POZ protein n=1 Tax=Rhizophagus clarus TaxID=94130 RepID=A0A2Z6QJ97_9GLOM|nr:hypothetical protein RclHR1_17040001 [Rhizophagus clarus]GES98368.1 BTB/POZ protein [Rhizophagus clarus]